MSIRNLYNSTKDTVSNVTGKLSDYFSGRTTYDNINPQPAAVSQAPIVKQDTPRRYELPDRGVQMSDEDFEKMRPLIYGEVSNRPYEKKALEADVIFNTALNRQPEYRAHGQDKSIADIVAMPNQYQAYNGSQYETYYNPQNPVDVAKKKEVDAIVDAIAEKIKKGEYVDNTEGAFYYVHEPDSTIKYDNLRKLFAE